MFCYNIFKNWNNWTLHKYIKMADFKEEAYVLEKMEISEDDDDGFEYKEIRDSDEEQIEDLAIESIADDEDDDLNDFNALKTKTE